MVSLYYRTVAVLSYDGGQGCATQKGGFSLQISLEMGHHAGTSPIYAFLKMVLSYMSHVAV